MRWRRSVACGAAAGVLIITTASSCREATSVVIEARTNLAYRAGLVTSFTVGGPGETERSEATTESRDPWAADGFVGSLVVVPGSSDDARLSVRVVLGVDRDARACAPPKYDGCIIARRLLRYTSHERLRLPIALYAQCKGIPCDAASTCNVLGQCVSAEVDLTTCTSDRGCVVPGDDRAGDPPARVDGGVEGSDAAADRTPPAPDATSDAPLDGASGGGSPGKIDCRTTTCDKAGATPLCCFNEGSQAGACIAEGMGCPMTGQIRGVTCDGPEDCEMGRRCCVAPPGTAVCLLDCGPYAPVCHSTGTCAVGTCTGLFAGYYRSCQ